MRIAVYYPWLYLTSGVERTILQLVKKSKYDYTVFTNYYDKNNTYPEFRNINVIELNRVSVKRDIFSVLRAAIIISFQKIDLTEFDVLLVQSDGLGDLITLRNKGTVPVVCYCHTPLRPVFDEYYRRRVLRKHTSIWRLFFYLFSRIYKTIDILLWKKFDYVYFNSKETLRRAKEGKLISFSKKNFQVLNPGVEVKNFNPSGIFKPYFLLPGRIMWTKNIELAINTFKRFKKESNFPKFKLLIAGQVDQKSKEYLEFLKNISYSKKDIKFIISPSDKKLKKLYSECFAVLLTSFNEDWGMTILEGYASGKPVISINRGGPRESVIDGKTGFLVNENEIDFARALEKIVSTNNLVQEMGENAYKLSKNYDVVNFINKLENSLKEIVSKS